MPIGQGRKGVRSDNASVRGWLRLQTSLPRTAGIGGGNGRSSSVKFLGRDATKPGLTHLQDIGFSMT